MHCEPFDFDFWCVGISRYYLSYLAMPVRKKVAIIGSGCTGIGALWALKSTDHEVHLYEIADRLGGHTNTVPFKHGEKHVAVDTGFIVFNTATYR